MRIPLVTTAAITGLLAGALAGSPADAAAKTKRVALEPAGTYATGSYGTSASEVTAHDPLTQQLFVVNAQSGAVDVLDVAAPDRPAKVGTLSMVGRIARDGSTIGAGAVVNSVDVAGGLLAVAVANATKTDPGWAAFFRTDGTFVAASRVGALPDMLTFTPDGGSVVVANEGEPDEGFTVDPEGSVSVVDVATGGVRTAGFGSYDTGRPLRPGVRVFGPDVAAPDGVAGRVARNLEPEYVAVDQQGRTAWVTLQENNALAIVDLRTATVRDVVALGVKSWNDPGGPQLDPSDRDRVAALRNAPVVGMYMPDALSAYQVRGRTYLVMANEGDAREWGDYEEPRRVGSTSYPLCAAEFPDAAALKAPGMLGRLQASTASGFDSARGCYSTIHAFGGRSFSIRDEQGGLVFDSGDLVERTVLDLIAAGELPAQAFNANHDESPSPEARSDDKGPEPEGVDVGKVDGRTYAFVGLERLGGVMTFDITDPARPVFHDYVNNRDFGAVYDLEDDPGTIDGAGDLGAEGVTFISRADSPTGEPLVAVANEVSGTTTLFRVRPRVEAGPGRG